MNDVGSSQLSSPHSVFLLMECLFFFLLFISVYFSVIKPWGIYFFFPSVNFGNEMHVSKAAHRNAAMNICLQTPQPVGKDSTITNKN